MSAKIISVDFEIYGRVQGVFFRKYTQKEALKLGLKGYCMNTSRGTVVGTIQGEPERVETMKNWLQNTGSPSSAIEKAAFRNETSLDASTYSGFVIKK